MNLYTMQLLKDRLAVLAASRKSSRSNIAEQQDAIRREKINLKEIEKLIKQLTADLPPGIAEAVIEVVEEGYRGNYGRGSTV